MYLEILTLNVTCTMITPLLYALPSLAFVASSSGAQIPRVSARDSDGSQRQIFTPELSARIETALLAGGVHGLTATAVFANDSSRPQFATYGYRTEDGDAVEKEVSRDSCCFFLDETNQCHRLCSL